MKIEAILDHQTILENRQSTALFRVRVQADPAPMGRTEALMIVLDRSASMVGAAFELAQKFAGELIRHLPPNARVGIVAFDETAESVVSLRDVSDKELLRAMLEQVEVVDAGSNFSAGWLLAREELRQAGGGKILMLSDGNVTEGIRDAGSLVRLVGQGADENLRTSTCLVNAGANAELLQAVASEGRGIWHSNGGNENIGKMIEAELGALLPLAAQNLRLRLKLLEFCEGVAGLGKHAAKVSQSDGWVEFQLGDLLLGEDRTFCFNLDIQPLPCIDGAPIASLENEALLDLEVWYEALSTQGVSSECFSQRVCVQSVQLEGKKTVKGPLISR